MISSYKMLVTSAKNCSAEIYLNDIPLYTVTPETTLYDSRAVDPFVVSGTNTLKAIIFPGATPTQVNQKGERRFADGEASLSINLSDYPPGAFEGDEGIVTLGQLNWKLPVDTEYETPVDANQAISITSNQAPWLWQKAPKMKLESRLKAEVFELLQTLRSCLNQGDPEPFIKASLPRFKEFALTYELDIDQRLDMFREQLQRNRKKPGWKIENISEETLELRLCGNNKMLDCLHKDWNSALRTKRNIKGIIETTYPIKLSMLKGELKIIR